jgi:hypothetical protein
MHSQFKKYLPLFFILLFLFPMVEKGMHDLEHGNDKHCRAKDKHFHELEHNCSVCDHTTVDLSSSLPADFVIIISAKQLLFCPFVESVNTPFAFQYLPARAPPLA